MNISPVLIHSITKNVSKQSNVLQKKHSSIVSDISNVRFGCNVPFWGNLEYQYKPISSKIQKFDLIDGQYKNIDEFSELFAQKLNSQLLTIEQSDIESLINRIKLKTKASDSLIKEVLYNLTLFSGYNSIDFFEKLTKKYLTNLFGINPLDKNTFSDASLNSALNYLSSEKSMFLPRNNEKRIVILDDNFLQEVEYAKYSKNPAYNDFINKVKNNELVFINLPSWDIKCLDGNYRSANFLLGTGFLENVAIDVIKRMYRNEELEDILYGDFEQRLRKIINIPDIQIHKIPIPQKLNPATDDILNNVKTSSVSKDKIKDILLNERKSFEPKNKRTEYIKALCKFLDEFSIVYSTNSMALDLTKIHEIAKSKIDKSKDFVYCIATDEKSPAYITSIFAKLNNIDPFKIMSCANRDYYELAGMLHNKEVIMLDDNSITGGSVLGFLSDIPSLDTYWLVLLATNEAINKLNDKKNNPIPKSFNYIKTLKNESKKKDSVSESKLLTMSEIELLKSNMTWGFEGSGVLCAFPYMIPDNCVDIGAALFDGLLFKDNPETNKPSYDYRNRIENSRSGYISFNGNYKPVAKIEPNYNLLNCDYSDTDKFCELFANKINSQLRAVELSDVEALSEKIKAQTGADMKLVYEVLYQLTLFANYNTFDILQNIVKNHSIKTFGFKRDYCYDDPSCVFTDISSNVALNYLANHKALIEPPEKSNAGNLVVLDGILLKELEYSKKNKTDFYKKFIKELKQGKIHLINLKGWDVQCSDGIYRSSAFLYGSGQLEDLAVDTIKRIQTGENIDDILYANIEIKLREIIGKDIKRDKIQISRIAPENFAKDKSLQDVFLNLKKPQLNPSEVENIMISKTGYRYFMNERARHILELFAKYLDEFSAVYSFDSMAPDLVELKKIIDKKYGKNVLYMMCSSNKSYGLIANIYAKLNNIAPESFFDVTFERARHDKIKQKTKYPTIILDDISASGKSVERQFREHGFNRLATKNMTYNFALLLASDKAEEVFYSDVNPLGELISARNIKDLCVSESDLLNDDELEELSLMLARGFGNVAISVSFPYIIPDNCSDLSATIFDKLLIKHNSYTNRALIS